MEKSKVRQIFEKACEMRKKAKAYDTAIKDFVAVVSPESRGAFFDEDQFTGFLEGVKVFNDNLHSEFSWFFYDISFTRNPVWEIRGNGKTYPITGEEDFAKYLESEYPLI